METGCCCSSIIFLGLELVSHVLRRTPNLQTWGTKGLQLAIIRVITVVYQAGAAEKCRLQNVLIYCSSLDPI